MDIWILFLVVILLPAGYAGVEARVRRVDRRLVQVERKLDLVLDRLGVTPEEPVLEQVAALVRDGRRIQAIKVYRELTGAGLKEAKEAVERMDG
ncbi:ribosomal protein L7/L12 [Streptomyces sp. NPDC048664]|uniref:ribosomal protein L7/L12 n=1 Tax=Streptomyces sp. NPDC048664 TaxID=3154505 RepID=UPI00341BAB11